MFRKARWRIARIEKSQRKEEDGRRKERIERFNRNTTVKGEEKKGVGTSGLYEQKQGVSGQRYSDSDKGIPLEALDKRFLFFFDSSLLPVKNVKC